MISFVSGKLYKKLESSVIIETGGIGYQIFVPASSIDTIGLEGDIVRLNTYMSVKEDGISLYGFLTTEELKMFGLLINVSGIGPKNAMNILTGLSTDALVIAILTGDEKALAKAPGVGKKTAQRIILELKDKFNALDMLPAGVTPQQSFQMANSSVNEAIDALNALGYSQSESMKAVMDVSQEGLNSQQIIKLALKKLAGG